MAAGGEARRRASGWRPAAIFALAGVVTTLFGVGIVLVDAAQRVAAVERMAAQGRADFQDAIDSGLIDDIVVDSSFDDQFQSALWLVYRSGADVPAIEFAPMLFDPQTGEQLAAGTDEVTAYLEEHPGESPPPQASYSLNSDGVPIVVSAVWSGGWRILPIAIVFASGLALLTIAAFSAASRWQDRARDRSVALAKLPSHVTGETNV